MKKIKVILSVLLSIMMLIGCMPLAGLVSAEESEDTVYTIFAAAPEKYDVGTDTSLSKTTYNTLKEALSDIKEILGEEIISTKETISDETVSGDTE